MVTSYHVVTGVTAQDLAQKLGTFLDDGWLPAGGVSVVFLPSGVMGRNREEYRYFQAVTFAELPVATPVAEVVKAGAA